MTDSIVGQYSIIWKGVILIEHSLLLRINTQHGGIHPTLIPWHAHIPALLGSTEAIYCTHTLTALYS